MLRLRFRGSLAIALSVSLALPPSVAAEEDAAVLAGKAQQVFRGARVTAARGGPDAARLYAQAGRLYGQAAAMLPEVEEHRGTRADLLGQAGSAYLEANRMVPADPAPLHAARTLAQQHLDALVASYGPGAPASVEYKRAAALMREVDGRLAALAGLTAAQRRATWRRVGLGTSLALASVSLAATIGTRWAIARTPITGPLYDDILAAARREQVPHGESDDMCQEGRMRGADAVDAACDARDRAWRSSIATGVLTGVFIASAITFAALVLRTRRKSLAQLHRWKAAVLVSPMMGGVYFAAGTRF